MWISKKKYDELVCRLNKFGDYMPEKLDKCRDDINDIQRVMENSKLGEITHKSILDETKFLFFSPCKKYDNSKDYTLIYKDFKEYKIVGLYLNKPKFEVDKKDNNLIHVKDNIKQLDGTIKVEEYIVDLQNQTFIRTK